MAKKTRGIQSIEVGGRILQVLAACSAPMTLKELALASGLAPAQCHAYLTSFRSCELVEQDAQSGHYKLGSFAMRLAMARIRSLPVLMKTSGVLVDLSSRLSKVAMMIVWGPQGPTVVQFQNGSAAVTLNLRPGTLYSVTGTASGRVFAAFGDDERIAHAIDAELSGQATRRFVGLMQTRSEFEAAVKNDRKLGYSGIEETPIPRLNAISAPIYDSSRRMCAAVTLFGEAEELSVAPDSPAVVSLLSVTRAISTGETDEHG